MTKCSKCDKEHQPVPVWHAWPVSDYERLKRLSNKLGAVFLDWSKDIAHGCGSPRRRPDGELRVPLGELCPGLGEVVAGRGYAPRSPGE